MTKQNPYRTIAKTLKVIGITVLSLMGLFVIVFLHAIVWQSGSGAWSLLLLPGVVVWFVVFGSLVYGLEKLGAWIANQWRDASWNWDRKNRKGI